MKGVKRLGQITDPNLDSDDSAFRSKRKMGAPYFDANRAESSRIEAPLEPQRAGLACQHVRALNSQFASWVQTQLQNHPNELWQDGVQDYLTHASQIMVKFKDVVDWLTANAEKTENVAAVLPSAEKSMVPEAKKNEVNFQLNNNKSGSPTFGTSTVAFASSWSFGLLPNKQASVQPGIQIPSFAKQGTIEDPDGENDLEQPSSPSLKKTEEKGVLVVHEAKCKVYVKPDDPSEKGWKDMGMGQLSIKCQEGASKAAKESKPTVVVRNDVGRVLLNALLYPGIKTHIQKNTITTIFHTLGAGGTNGSEAAQDGVAKARTYLLRLKTEDDTNKLAAAIKEYAPAA